MGLPGGLKHHQMKRVITSLRRLLPLRQLRILRQELGRISFLLENWNTSFQPPMIFIPYEDSVT